MPVCDAHVLERLRLLDGSQSWWPRPRADRSAHIIVGRGRGKGDVETVVREALREARTAACERRSLRVEANGQLVRAHRRLKQIFGVALEQHPIGLQPTRLWRKHQLEAPEVDAGDRPIEHGLPIVQATPRGEWQPDLGCVHERQRRVRRKPLQLEPHENETLVRHGALAFMTPDQLEYPRIVVQFTQHRKVRVAEHWTPE